MAASEPTSTSDSRAPLAGRSVVVTRSAAQSAALIAPLQALGATVLAFPVIETVEPDDWSPADAAIAHLDSYDWIVLTSANAVRCFFNRLAARGVADSAVDSSKIAVVGQATARALEKRGLIASLVPDDFRAEGLVDEFVSRGVGAGHRLLVPRALEAREILPDTMRERGAIVDVVPVYRTVRAKPDSAAIERLVSSEVDAVTFTSPSTFRNFRGVVADAGHDADALLRSVAIASIGPVTSEAVRAHGHTVAVEAEVYTVEGLVAALAEHFTGE